MLVPSVSAEDLQPVTVVDLFEDIDLNRIVFVTGCGQQGNTAAEFVVDAANRTFRFYEGTPQSSFVTTSRYAFVGCATATYSASLPSGTDHIHVRFAADRFINAQIPDLTHSFTQSLLVSFDGGAPVVLDYFVASSPSQPPTNFDPAPFAVPPEAKQVTLQWLFRDAGTANGTRNLVNEINGRAGTDLANPVSFHALSAAISLPQVEFSGPAIPGQVHYAQRVIEDKESQQTRVGIAVQPGLVQAFQVNLRVEVDETLRLVEVITPNGTHLRQFTSNPLAGTPGFRPYGPDGDRPLVEPRIDFYRATLPGELVAAHGAGTYTFVFAREVPLDAPFELLLVVFLVLALPFLMGARALWGIRAFRNEAFGLYKKSATALLAGVILVLAYYLAFVVQMLQQGQHLVMAHWPMASRGLLLYLNVLLAVAALAAFGLVGRRLHDITRPAQDL